MNRDLSSDIDAAIMRAPLFRPTEFLRNKAFDLQISPDVMIGSYTRDALVSSFTQR